MLKKTIPLFIIISSALLIISGLTLFTKAAPRSANNSEQLQTQKQLIISYIESANSVDAQAEYDNLITDYAGNRLLPDAVYDIAEAYRNNAKFEESLQVYADVVNNWPESSSAVWAQRGLAISNIALDRMQEAQVELNKLQKSFSTDPNIAEAVFNVADTYYWFKRYDEADSLYRYVSENYPYNDFAMWAQMGLAILNIADGNEIAAQDAINRLVTEFWENEKLPEALFYIAGRYAWDKKYQQAKNIYENIIQNWPESSIIGEAEFGLLRSSIFTFIESQDEPNAFASIETLIADYNNNPDTPGIVFEAGERYFTKALKDSSEDLEAQARNDFTKAIILWETIITEFPQSPVIPQAYYFSALSYRRLGEYTKTIEYCTKIIADRPDYEYAWNCKSLIEICQQQLIWQLNDLQN